MIAQRFRGFLPVVIDVETGGFNAETDALLELAAVFISIDGEGSARICEEASYQVQPFAGANIEQAALDFTGIQPDNPLRHARPEEEVLKSLFSIIRKRMKETECKRSILVGHNAFFDLGFLKKASERCDIKRDPFHPFSCIDTASLSAVFYGHTVLAQACKRANIEFSNSEAHTALYDARKTAELFCKMINQWKSCSGWTLDSFC